MELVGGAGFAVARAIASCAATASSAGKKTTLSASQEHHTSAPTEILGAVGRGTREIRVCPSLSEIRNCMVSPWWERLSTLPWMRLAEADAGAVSETVTDSGRTAACAALPT